MMNSRTISIRVSRPYETVYEFLAEPRNFPSWASNLGPDFVRLNSTDWVTTTRNGRLILRFAVRNDYGVLDHAVFAEGTEPATTPMRVIANADGAEIIYTQFQRPGMSDEAFLSEIEWVTSDFEALRSLLESEMADDIAFHDGPD